MVSNSLRTLIIAVLLITGIFSCNTLAANQPASCPNEPTAELAKAWWPPQKNVWTPVGWKDHLFRFNVLYNGTIIADPHPAHPWGEKKQTQKWESQGVQLVIAPSAFGVPPAQELPNQKPYQISSTLDKGLGNQGWRENPTPVLWTRWPMGHDLDHAKGGLVLEEDVFAHIQGTGDVVSGIEPLYAWIRLSISHVDEMQAPKEYSFMIHIGNINISRFMQEERNLMVDPAVSAYPRMLTAESFTDGGKGLRIMDEKYGVRLIALPSNTASFEFIEYKPSTRNYYLKVTLPVCKGAYADLLLPIVPAASKDINEEMSLGFKGALAESDKYWSITPDTASKILTPEKQINEAITQTVKFAELITEKNPETGEYSFLSGSGHYDTLWSTPTSMVGYMLLDILGYHSVVEKHIEIFKTNQGTVKPPGPAYKLHPGYFSSPKTLTSIDWLSDHGAILYEVSKHALLSGDKKFTDRWMDNIIKGCEFIRDARAIKDHNGVPGVLPPAVATDLGIATQSVWNIGWHYKGLTAAVRLLRQIGHPRAEEFAAEARDYKETFQKAFREQAQTMPRWTDSKGSKHPVVPLTLSKNEDFLHPFYLDCGPMFLVWSGLMDANDELMRTSVSFFREGPNIKLFDPRGNLGQRPILIHEMSSCEPTYSWNVFHSWQLADRYRYLEGMYSILEGGMSPQTYISCETRHGIYGNIFASVLLVDLVRLSVIDDEIQPGQLHLLRLVPKVWLNSKIETEFVNMPTEFGTVTIKFKPTEDGKTLKVSYKHDFRRQPEKIIFYAPPIAGLKKVIINGKAMNVQPGDSIDISKL